MSACPRISFIHPFITQPVFTEHQLCAPVLHPWSHGASAQLRQSNQQGWVSTPEFFRVSLFHFLKTDFFSPSGLCSSPLSQFPWVGKKYFCLFLFSLLWMMPGVRLDTAGRTGSRVAVVYEVVLSMKSPQAVTPLPGSTPHTGAWLVYSE